MTGFSVDVPGINNQQVPCSPEYLHTSFMLLCECFYLEYALRAYSNQRPSEGIESPGIGVLDGY